MKTLTITGQVDQKGQLHADVPADLPPGYVQLLLLVPDEEDESESGDDWIRGIAKEWAAELGDPREDIYTLEDGKPLDGYR